MRRPDPDTIRRNVEAAIRALEHIANLTPNLLADAARFDKGFPPQSLGGTTTTGSGSSVETAATSRGLSGRVDEWLTELDEMFAHITARESRAVKLTAHGREARKIAAAICQVCGEPGITWPRGLCDHCRDQWDTYRTEGGTMELAAWKVAAHRHLFPERKQPFGVDWQADEEQIITSRRPA